MTAFPPPPLGPRVALPPVERTALVLDLDGTLLDIAPAPDLVVVPPGLPNTLRRLRTILGSALGIITGRPIEQVDALLPDIPYAVAGEHGAALRYNPETTAERPLLPAVPAGWLELAKNLVAKHAGVLFEPKEHGFAVHFRAAPELADRLRRSLEELVAGQPDRFVLLPARMAWEVRPRGADKGKALASLMARPPFAGRVPVFVGDDVTDEDAIVYARSVGGIGLRVPEAFGDAVGVRAWLGGIGADGA
jgi:trehalose 6-phosphate phosphatase